MFLITVCGSVYISDKIMNDYLYFFVYGGQGCRHMNAWTLERLIQYAHGEMWAVRRLISLIILRFKTNHLDNLENNNLEGLPLFALGLSPCLKGTSTWVKGDYVLFLKFNYHLIIKKTSYLSLFSLKQIASGMVTPVLLSTAKLTFLYVPQYSFPFHYWNSPSFGWTSEQRA